MGKGQKWGKRVRGRRWQREMTRSKGKGREMRRD
jgi:hypothetical protein